MRKLVFPTALLFMSFFAQAQLPTTTTLAQQTGNNTSAANTFTTQTDGNLGAGNISKLPIRSLLYPGATTRIFAHVEPWWGSGSHINIGYSSQDPAQVHRQVQDMVSRGIDGAVVDWYGPGSYEDTGVKLLIAEAEATPNFNVLVEIDVGAINWHSCYPTCSATTAVINLFTAANTAFFSSPAIYKSNGRPVLMEFGMETLSLPSGAASGWNVIDWNAVQTQTPGNLALVHRNLGGYTKAQSTGAFVWMEPVALANFTAGFDDTSDLDWFYSNSVKSYAALAGYGAVWKGFNDTLAGWSADRHIDQNCGKTWLNTFARLNQYYSATNQLPFMQMVTWNDYEEGTEVESGIDNCLNLTASLTGTQLQWNAGGDESTLDHYTVYASTDGQNLASLGDFSTSTHALDLSTVTMSAGSYSVYVQAVGKPTIRNQMSAAVSYTVAPSTTTGTGSTGSTTGTGSTGSTGTGSTGTTGTGTGTTGSTGTGSTGTGSTGTTGAGSVGTNGTGTTGTGSSGTGAGTGVMPVVVKDVTLSVAPAAQTVNRGQAGQYALTLAEVGATDPVQLSCSAPAGMTCKLDSTSITPNAAGSQVQLTVTATQTAALEHTTPVFAAVFSSFGLLGLAGSSRRRKIAAGCILGIVLLTQLACGGGSLKTAPANSATTTTATPSTTYTITVNAVSGAVTKSTAVTLTVN